MSLNEGCKQEKIHVFLPKSFQPGYVWIGNTGLMGGVKMKVKRKRKKIEAKHRKIKLSYIHTC
jgi:hypothetical protein